MTTLGLAMNPARRAPYDAILDHDNFHHVSPAYAARFKRVDESEEAYVERLRQELEDKFLELGPDTVIGCELNISYCLFGLRISAHSRGGACGGFNNWMRSSAKRIFQGDVFRVQEVWSSLHTR